jgi:hypothetical protein
LEDDGEAVIVIVSALGSAPAGMVTAAAFEADTEPPAGPMVEDA